MKQADYPSIPKMYQVLVHLYKCKGSSLWDLGQVQSW